MGRLFCIINGYLRISTLVEDNPQEIRNNGDRMGDNPRVTSHHEGRMVGHPHVTADIWLCMSNNPYVSGNNEHCMDNKYTCLLLNVGHNGYIYSTIINYQLLIAHVEGLLVRKSLVPLNRSFYSHFPGFCFPCPSVRCIGAPSFFGPLKINKWWNTSLS